MKNRASGMISWKWLAILVSSVVLLLLAIAVIFVYVKSSQGIGSSITSVPGQGQNDNAAQARLEALRSLPYVTWTEEDVDTTQTGVIKNDIARAFPGYNIYTNDVDKVFIMDMDGQVVHSWDLPGGRHCELAEFLEEGAILVICVSQGLIKLDWSGQVLWELPVLANHDVAVLSDGSLFVSVMEPPRSYKSASRVNFDSIMHVSADGKPLASWSTFTNLVPLQATHQPLALDSPMRAFDEKTRNKSYDYYHLNTIEAIPDTPLGQKDKRFQAGNILLSLRNANTIVILDKRTMEIQWSWGSGDLDFQHMPTMLDNGNLLIYDNGAHRSFSRVIEIDPLSKEIVWEYQASPPSEFYSKWRGSNQRFPNGNTLICDSENGRVFEVTSEGEVVWDFWNPEIKNDKRKRIYRMMRLPTAQLDRFLQDQ